jgi:multidrug transporter EmrE-like cation transporter
MWDIGVMCILQLISQQMALNLIIVNFKQYIYPLISSTRRIIVLIVSIVIFEHNLSLLQWICVALISSGIIAELLNEIKSKEGSSSLESQR